MVAATATGRVRGVRGARPVRFVRRARATCPARLSRARACTPHYSRFRPQPWAGRRTDLRAPPFFGSGSCVLRKGQNENGGHFFSLSFCDANVKNRNGAAGALAEGAYG